MTHSFVIPGSNGRLIPLDITLPDGDGPHPIAIFIHGLNGFKDWGPRAIIADTLAAQGLGFLRFNPSHNGTTPEHPAEFVALDAHQQNTFGIELHDIGLVIDFLHSNSHQLPIDTRAISLIGHSRGGGLAIIKATDDSRVSKIVTWASVGRMDWMFTPERIETLEKDGVFYVTNSRTGQQMPYGKVFYEDYLANQARYDLAARLKTMQMPLLIVHGTADPAVHHNAAYGLFEHAANAQLVLIDDADHVFGQSYPFVDTELPEHTQRLLQHTIAFLNPSWT